MFTNIIFTALNKLSEQSEFSVHAEWQEDGGSKLQVKRGHRQ